MNTIIINIIGILIILLLGSFLCGATSITTTTISDTDLMNLIKDLQNKIKILENKNDQDNPEEHKDQD